MRRYRYITSSMPVGAFGEFSAHDDTEALAEAEKGLYGARLVTLTDVTDQYVPFGTCRTVEIPA